MEPGTHPEPHVFFRNWLETNYPRKSLNSIAQQSGLSSRGQLHDLLTGRRPFTLKTIEKIAAGLKLRGTEHQYFKSLVTSRQSDGPNLDLKKLNHLREKLNLGMKRKVTVAVPRSQHWDIVYASLSGTAGTTRELISLKCNLPETHCKRVLSELCKLDLVRIDADGLYYPNSLHHLIQDQEGALLRYLEQSFSVQAKSMKRKFSGPQKGLYQAVAFSVAREDFSRLREKLKKTLEQFVFTSENPSGDAISKIVIGFELI